MARLISSVHVADESGVSHVFGPTDAIPSWAAARITNPAAWDGAPPEPEVTEPVVAETETASESETVTEDVVPETVTEDVVPESAPESESVPATEEEPTPDLVAESVPEPEPAVAAPKRRGRPAKAATN